MQLLAPLVREPQPSPLLSMAALEALGAAVCEPGARTTDPPILSQLLASSASLGRPLFRLAMHPANRGADGAALLMRAIAESGASAALPMREAALREGAFLHHLIPASFGKGHRFEALAYGWMQQMLQIESRGNSLTKYPLDWQGSAQP